jgi:hypothetical protein
LLHSEFIITMKPSLTKPYQFNAANPEETSTQVMWDLIDYLRCCGNVEACATFAPHDISKFDMRIDVSQTAMLGPIVRELLRARSSHTGKDAVLFMRQQYYIYAQFRWELYGQRNLPAGVPPERAQWLSQNPMPPHRQDLLPNDNNTEGYQVESKMGQIVASLRRHYDRTEIRFFQGATERMCSLPHSVDLSKTPLYASEVAERIHKDSRSSGYTPLTLCRHGPVLFYSGQPYTYQIME